MAKAITSIRIFQLAGTETYRGEIRNWLKDMGVGDGYELPSKISDAALLTGLAAKQCYLSFEPGLNPNVTKVRKDWVDYLDNVLSQKHGSVLAHAHATFGINGCTRVFTGELNRHGVGTAISERSMRYIKMDNLEYWLPQCFRANDASDNVELEMQKEASREIMQESFEFMEKQIARLTQIWAEELSPASVFHAKKELTSAFRRIIGMGVSTGGVWTFSIRALRHILAVRTSPGAEEEIAWVFTRVGKRMIDGLYPLLNDFKIENGSFLPLYEKV